MCACVRACTCACACVHVLAVCGCSESMNDVTDNVKNNFGDPLDAMYIDRLCIWTRIYMDTYLDGHVSSTAHGVQSIHYSARRGQAKRN